MFALTLTILRNEDTNVMTSSGCPVSEVTAIVMAGQGRTGHMGNRALPGGPPLQGAHPSSKQYNNMRGPNNYRCPGPQSGASPPLWQVNHSTRGEVQSTDKMRVIFIQYCHAYIQAGGNLNGDPVARGCQLCMGH